MGKTQEEWLSYYERFDEESRLTSGSGLLEFARIHRTLETYAMAFLDAGFASEAIREPRPTQEQAEQDPNIDDELRVPNFIIFVLRKPALLG